MLNYNNSYILTLENIFEKDIRPHQMIFKSKFMNCISKYEPLSKDIMVAETSDSNFTRFVQMFKVLNSVRNNFDWKWIAIIKHIPSMRKYIKLYKFYNLSLCNKGILQWPYYAALDHWLLGASW